MKGLALALGLALAALPAAQAAMTLEYGPVYQGPLDELVDPLDHGCQIVTVNVLPPGWDVDENCLPGQAAEESERSAQGNGTGDDA